MKHLLKLQDLSQKELFDILDLASELKAELKAGKKHERRLDGKTLGLIHMLKTCALIKASVLMGCYAAGAEDELCILSEKYAEAFGLAFQIIDDILDFDGDYNTCELNSYVKVHGLEKARKDAFELIENAKKILSEFSKKGFDISNFEELLEFLVKRMK